MSHCRALPLQSGEWSREQSLVYTDAMDLRSLEVLYWVVKLGGFGKAAERLHMTHPGVSQRIAQLEARYKLRLLDRNSHRVASLTPKGAEIFAYAERILTMHADMMSLLSNAVGLGGIVRLGVSETVVHTILSALVRLLHERHPQATPEITVDISPNLQSALLTGELDVALLLGPINEPQVCNIKMCDYELIWIASPQLTLPTGSIDPDALAQFPILSYARGTLPHAQIVDMFARSTFRPQIFANASISTILRMAIDGIGIGLLPRVLVQADVAAGSLVEVHVNKAIPPLHYTASYIKTPGDSLARAVAELSSQVATGDLHAS